MQEWIKRAAEEIRALTVGEQILAKWDAEWNERIAAIIAKHEPVIGVDLSRDAKDYSMMVEGYRDKDGLHITDTQRVFTDEQVRELVEAARAFVPTVPVNDDNEERRLRRALEPFKEVR